MHVPRDPCAVSHVADAYRRYPGEKLTLYTRVQAWEPRGGLTLRVTVPDGLTPGLTRAPDDALPRVAQGTGGCHLLWDVPKGGEAGARYEYQVETEVAPTPQDAVLESQAVVTWGEASFSTSESVSVAVSARGRYLKHLPALYRTDELMGRFLMLFESFWAPIGEQIDQLPLYFDPRMTPPDFLPWLASWLDLALDGRWPEERRRLLLRSAASLYRKRGTRQGLQEYLEIYSGAKAEIVEHRASNFCLGPQARLGPGVALGTANVPHTFTVVLRLPPLAAGEQGARGASERLRMIEAIIEAEKPAHTSYVVHIETH
jgi:phage tail-like protein